MKEHTDEELVVASTILKRLKILKSYEPSVEDLLRDPDLVKLKNAINNERDKLHYGDDKVDV